jgi:hypothetical protein
MSTRREFSRAMTRTAGVAASGAALTLRKILGGLLLLSAP